MLEVIIPGSEVERFHRKFVARPQEEEVKDQFFWLDRNAAPFHLSYDWAQRPNVGVAIAVPGSDATVHGSSVGLTEDEAAAKAVLKALEAFLSVENLQIYGLGTQREKREGFSVLQYDTCRHVYANYKGVAFKGYGKDRIPAKALALAVIALANKIAWAELNDPGKFRTWERQTSETASV